MTATEMEVLLRKVLSEGLTLDSYTTLAIGAVIFVAVVAGVLLGAYARQKGKNLATKEDFGELLAQVKRTTEETENIKERISRSHWVKKKRWDLKHDLYFRIIENIGQQIVGVSEIKMDAVNKKWTKLPDTIVGDYPEYLETITEFLRLHGLSHLILDKVSADHLFEITPDITVTGHTPIADLEKIYDRLLNAENDITTLARAELVDKKEDEE